MNLYADMEIFHAVQLSEKKAEKDVSRTDATCVGKGQHLSMWWEVHPDSGNLTACQEERT